MLTSGTGIILFKKALNEKGFLLKILAHDLGIISGYAYNSKKYSGVIQAGNYISFNKKQKTKEQLGMLTLELINSHSINLIGNKLRLYAFLFVSELISETLQEEEESDELFVQFKELLTANNFLNNVIHILQNLLKISGYSLSLDKCVASNTKNNLHYISPKTGCAVCFDEGKAYKDKLFIFPRALKNLDNLSLTASDYLEAIKLLMFFIDKFIYSEHQKKLPNSYNNFIKNINV